MENHRRRKPVKQETFLWHDQDGTSGGHGGVCNVHKLRGYYDEARHRLKNYLAMGSGSSSPRSHEEGAGAGDDREGAMFEQRPPHCRLEGKNQVSSDDEFTDVSYTDLGHIITPQAKKLPVNNNYKSSRDGAAAAPQSSHHSTPTPPSATDESYLDNDCDLVSSEVDSGHPGASSSVASSNKGSKSSFGSSQLPGAATQDYSSSTNLGDLQVEEITS
ncbi:uncharacterized protein [Procambarus clarkii]|uniref:uncharacterized protein isoform X2 n=1 Tax=Procambarus clarkii TaxID=6728 RepID=UPI0037439E7C